MKLFGDYVTPPGEVRLVWETGAIPSLVRDVPYYYCVFRKAPGEDAFHYVENIASEAHEYTDNIPRRARRHSTTSSSDSRTDGRANRRTPSR